ncbi:MAG: helix-turn-helix transcriptional regulator [Myxococcota bacterium]
MNDGDRLRGLRISEAMLAAGVSSKELQEALGLGRTAVWRYITGRAVPPRDRAAKMAEVLGTTPDWLLHGVGQRDHLAAGLLSAATHAHAPENWGTMEADEAHEAFLKACSDVAGYSPKELMELDSETLERLSGALLEAWRSLPLVTGMKLLETAPQRSGPLGRTTHGVLLMGVAALGVDVLWKGGIAAGQRSSDNVTDE